MADNLWPASLPQHPLIRRARLQPQVWTARTQMDAGPAKLRRRRTVHLDVWSMAMVITSAQLITFREFFHNTSQQGTLAFDWVDPIDGTTEREFRFSGQYSVEPLDTRQRWEVTFEVEVLPLVVGGGTPPTPTDPPGGGHAFLNTGNPGDYPIGGSDDNALEDAIVQSIIFEADTPPPDINVVLFANVGGGFDGMVPFENEDALVASVPNPDAVPPGTIIQLENMAVDTGVS